jgi:glycosyltransferase involved in cell wall biosynthesis
MVFTTNAASEKPPILPQHSSLQPTTTKPQPNRNTFPSSLRNKRILLATESLGPVNGVSRTTRSLIEYLRANGANVAVVAPRLDNEKRFNLGSLASANIRLNGQPLPYNPDLTVVHPFRYDRLCTRTFKPDLVYLASPASVGFQFLLQIRQLQEPPAVVCNFQTDLSAYSEIIFPPGMDRFAVWLLGLVQGFLFNHRSVYTIFYPCSDIRKYLEEVGAPQSKLAQLGRGVDTVLFNPAHRDESYRKQLAPNGEIILTCICRLAPEKGFKFLADAAERLAQAHLPFKLHIVGGNRNPAVERDVQRYFDKVQDHVIFSGFLTGTDLARAYAAADLFLHCSITETFGLVVLEAMASGMPVIARDQGGPSEIVRDGKTGYLVPPNDLNAFVERTLLLARDDSLRAEMAAAALIQANDTTWDKINQRVAWNLADGIEWNAAQQLERRRPIRNWLYRRWYHLKLVLVLPLLQLLNLHAAIGVVCLFWVIAVLPLMVHGNSRFFSGLGVKGVLSGVRGWMVRASLPLPKH